MGRLLTLMPIGTVTNAQNDPTSVLGGEVDVGVAVMMDGSGAPETTSKVLGRQSIELGLVGRGAFHDGVYTQTATAS